MVIYGPNQKSYDIDVGPVMLSDWYHPSYQQLVLQTMTPNQNPVFSDNNLSQYHSYPATVPRQNVSIQDP